VVGVIAILGLVLGRPAWWVAVTPLVAVGAFGLWGTLERERAAHSLARGTTAVGRAIVAAQWTAVVVGTGAILLAAFRVLGALIGTVIS